MAINLKNIQQNKLIHILYRIESRLHENFLRIQMFPDTKFPQTFADSTFPDTARNPDDLLSESLLRV